MIEWTNNPDRGQPRFFVGLDLGQAQDPTAVVVIERHGDYEKAVCHLHHLERYKLSTSYPHIVEDVSARLARAPAGTRLILDGTGVGRAVVDLVRQHPLLADRQSHIHAVTITAGDQASQEHGYWRVPKRDLVGAVQVLLQSQRLKIASNLPETPTLINELMNFKVKITDAANDTYGAWREGLHDDLVLAAALACWAATHQGINGEFRQGVWRR